MSGTKAALLGEADRAVVTATRNMRLRYVDSLRVYAVALVFVIHVCEVFNPWDEWHITNAERSRVLGEIVVLMAPWIMPLVMLLAGVSAWYALPARDTAPVPAPRARTRERSASPDRTSTEARVGFSARATSARHATFTREPRFAPTRRS